MSKTEYQLIPLNVRTTPSEWERRINEAAGEGFEWVEAFPGPEGETYVIMRREQFPPS